jgi:hypothetical protein
MMTIKKLPLIFCAISMALLNGCDSLKSDDDKIKDALIGKIYEEDYVDKDGNKIKNIKGEFFKDGKFRNVGTFEIVDDETFETTDLTMEIAGGWSIKDKFIYYTYDFDKLKITPEIYMLMKDELIKSIKDKNTPDKVIEYDASKIIYENSDGERHTMKKSY